MQAIIFDGAVDNVDNVRRELLAWAEGLGVDVKLARPRFVLVKVEQKWRAIFSYARQRDGHDYVLPGTNRIAIDYGVYAVDVSTWPDWFPPPSEVPLMTAASMLELLDIAEEASRDLSFRTRVDSVQISEPGGGN